MKSKRPAPLPASKPASSPEIVAPSLRRYLYATAATTGAAIMIVEILGAKMLAPYVGTSHFVWTAQIAVTLVALSAGYYVGGRLVDRSQRLGRVYWAILGAAAYLSAAVLVVEPVAYWCLDFQLALGSLMASAFLFFLPLALLAMVGPYFIRVLTSTVSGVGGNIGRLTAISTLGSFAGTILIGYVLIPKLANSTTMYLTSCALMAVAAGYFFGWGRKKTSPMAAVVAIAAGLALGGEGVARDRMISLPAVGEEAAIEEVYRANSNFGRLQVLNLSWPGSSEHLRYYMNDLLVQNNYDPVAKQSIGAFTYMLHDLAHAYNSGAHDILCIGMGVGIVPMEFAREGARVDIVEINPAVLPVAEKYFNFDPKLVHLTIDDGRHYLNRCRTNYDAIILDAFIGDSSPSHLLSRQAFAAMRHVLKPGGVLIMNTFGSRESGEDFFAASVSKTLQSVFRQVRICGTGERGVVNMFFAASDQPEMTLGSFPNLEEVPVIKNCRQEVEHARTADWITDPADGIVLTDDYNPLEYYDAANREEMRRNLALSTRKMTTGYTKAK